MINLLVRNLPTDVTDAELHACFAELGRVVRVSGPTGDDLAARRIDLEGPTVSQALQQLAGATLRGRLLDVSESSGSETSGGADSGSDSSGSDSSGSDSSGSDSSGSDGSGSAAEALSAAGKLAGERADHLLTRERIQAYIWARYVEYEAPPYPLDEDQALAFLEAHYRTRPMSEDAECYYFGILAYERSFASPALRRPLLLRALQAFQAYRQQTSADFTWDIIDDRYADLIESLGADSEPEVAR